MNNARVLLPALLCSCTLGMVVPAYQNAFSSTDALQRYKARNLTGLDACMPESLNRFIPRLSILKHQYYKCQEGCNQKQKYKVADIRYFETSDPVYENDYQISELEAHDFKQKHATLRVVGWSDVPEQDFVDAFGAKPSEPAFDGAVKDAVQCQVDTFLESVDAGTDVLVQWDADKVRGDKFTACLKGIAEALGDRFAGFYAVKRINRVGQYWSGLDWGKVLFDDGFVKNELVEKLGKPCYLQVAPVADAWNSLPADRIAYASITGDAWGAYVSHMLASNAKPHMVIALGGGASVAEAKLGYAPNAILRYIDVTNDGKTGKFITFARSEKGHKIGWRPVTDTNEAEHDKQHYKHLNNGMDEAHLDMWKVC